MNIISAPILKIAKKIYGKDICWPGVISLYYYSFFLIILFLNGLDLEMVYMFIWWLGMAIMFGALLWSEYETNKYDVDLKINYSDLSTLGLPGLGLWILSRIVFFYKYWFNFIYLRCEGNRRRERIINKARDTRRKLLYPIFDDIAKIRDYFLIINLIFECCVLGCIFYTKANVCSVYLNNLSNLYLTWRINAILFNFLGNVFFKDEYKIILMKSNGLNQDVISNSRNAIIALIGLFQIQLCFAGIWMNLGKGSGDIWERLQLSVKTSLLDTKECNKESLLVLIHHGVVFIYTVLILVVFVSSLGGLSDKPETGKSSNNTVK